MLNPLSGEVYFNMRSSLRLPTERYEWDRIFFWKVLEISGDGLSISWDEDGQLWEMKVRLVWGTFLYSVCLCYLRFKVRETRMQKRSVINHCFQLHQLQVVIKFMVGFCSIPKSKAGKNTIVNSGWICKKTKKTTEVCIYPQLRVPLYGPGVNKQHCICTLRHVITTNFAITGLLVSH